MLAILGAFQFEINTAAYDKLKRATKYNWPKQARFGTNPAPQFTGYDEDTISLSGTIYPGYKGGLKQIDAMRKMAQTGNALSLVFGYGNAGNALGNWVIDSITEEQMYFHRSGQPRKQTFNLELSYYGKKNT